MPFQQPHDLSLHANQTLTYCNPAEITEITWLNTLTLIAQRAQLKLLNYWNLFLWWPKGPRLLSIKATVKMSRDQKTVAQIRLGSSQRETKRVRQRWEQDLKEKGIFCNYISLEILEINQKWAKIFFIWILHEAFVTIITDVSLFVTRQSRQLQVSI